MADVQIENGFTRLADELLDALARTDIQALEMRVLLVVIRLTYGYGKTEDRIGASQLAERGRMSRGTALSVVAKLEQRGILRVTRHGNRRRRTLGIEKNFDLWLPRDGPFHVETDLPAESVATTPTDLRGESVSGQTDLPEQSDLTYQRSHSIEKREKKRERAPATAGATASDLISEHGFRLSPRKVEQLRQMRPRGILYSAEQVAAWFIAKAPKMQARGLTNLTRAAPNWWESVTPEEIADAEAALSNRRFQDRFGERAEDDEPEPTPPLGGWGATTA